MVDEILSTFQEELFGKYDEILASDDDARTKLERAVRVSFEAIDQHPHEVAIFQNEADYLGALRAVRLPRRAQRPVAPGLDDAARPRASRPACCAATSTSSSSTASSATPCGSPSGGTAPAARSTHDDIADQYLTILLDGICHMPEAYIVDAVRTPVGKRGGALAEVHSADLGAHMLAALMRRTGVDPGAVDDVILGCCDTIGSQAGDVARTAWLVAGPARPRARRDHRPAVRLVPAGGALRRPGRHVRHPGPGRRRRRAEHERDPDLGGDAGRPAVRLLDAVRRVARLAGAVRRPGGQPVPLAPR